MAIQVIVNSAFSIGMPGGVSRSTTTFTLPSGTSRVMAFFGAYATGGGGNGEMSGNSVPTFGGVALSEVTRPVSTGLLHNMFWITPISDGSSGDYSLNLLKNSATDSFEGVGFFLSNVSSNYVSAASQQLNAGPAGLNTNFTPTAPNQDMVIGVIFHASGATTTHAQLGDGVPVFSSITPGGSTPSGVYVPSASAVTMQGISSVSFLWSVSTSVRWRVNGMLFYPWNTSQITFAGTVVSSATTSSAVSSIVSCTVQKDGSTNQAVMVFVGGYDAANHATLPIVRVDGTLANLMARNDYSDASTSPGEVKTSAWIANVSGTGASVVSVACDNGCGVTALVMVGVDQLNPVSIYSTGANGFNAGPMTSEASVSVTTQAAIGFGSANYGRIPTAGSGETSISTVQSGTTTAANATAFCNIVTMKDAVTPLVAFSEPFSNAGSGRWRHTAIVLNLDGNIPPVAPDPGSPYFYRRRQHPFDW